MVLVQKWPFFQLFFSGNLGHENVFQYILERKSAFLSYKNNKLKKSRNWHFSEGVNPCLWSKNDRFSNFFFLGNIGQENVYYDILERKNAFLDLQKTSSKSRKIDIFSKGLTHGFGPKMADFPTLFFRQYRPEKCLLRYSRTKRHLSRL